MIYKLILISSNENVIFLLIVSEEIYIFAENLIFEHYVKARRNSKYH
jgi:hypothetical protein